MRSQPVAPARRDWTITRRIFLKASGACLTGLAVGPLACRSPAGARPNSARFGIITDSHYANRQYSTRYCSESLDKMTECVELMNEQKVSFLIELGDFKDQDDPPVEANTIAYLQAAEGVCRKFTGPVYHVLGNHDMDSISKAQFLANVQNKGIASGASYYSFNLNGLHFVVLDANFSSDGTAYDHGNFTWTDAIVPPVELDWLRQDLASAKGPVIVFIHQLLDGTGSYYVGNAAAVRQILEACGKVMAVFQGHHHSGSYSQIEGIHYYTLKALVEGSGAENNAYAIVEVHSDRSITVSAYRKAMPKQLPANPLSGKRGVD